MTFQNFNETTGLLDNVIYGILEDDAGRIWLSTDKGLCAYDPVKQQSQFYESEMV